MCGEGVSPSAILNGCKTYSDKKQLRKEIVLFRLVEIAVRIYHYMRIDIIRQQCSAQETYLFNISIQKSIPCPYYISLDL